MNTVRKTSAVEAIALEQVPLAEKKSWTSIAFIWAGNVICVPALMVGGMIASGLNFVSSVLAMLLGFGLVCVYMSFIGSQAADLGRPSTVIFSRCFGTRGSGFAVSLVLAVCCTGWFAFQTYVCGSSFVAILQTYFGFNFPLWLSCLIWGAAMFITSVYGFGVIKILNLISVPALILILIYGVGYVLMQPGAGAAILAYAPPTPTPFIVGLTMAVSGFAVGAVISGDFTRYAKSRRDTVLSTFVGVIPCGVGALVIGSMLAIYAGNYDITVMFSSMGIPLLGLVVLILATWTTNTGNAYSAGIAVVNLFKLNDDKRPLVTLILGLIGTVLAIVGVINVFTTFLSFITAFLPPMAGVAIADYWIKGRGRFDNWEAWPGVNWLGIASWAAGIAVAMATSFFVPTINGIIASLIVYLILINLVKHPKLNPFTAL
ncbi:MAG: cytosine permease [Clostridiales Family XIII bacterium]|jgi:cytosine permease|nr:cytosine permease [Clostridiales Family XIII bacterium]